MSPCVCDPFGLRWNFNNDVINDKWMALHDLKFIFQMPFPLSNQIRYLDFRKIQKENQFSPPNSNSLSWPKHWIRILKHVTWLICLLFVLPRIARHGNKRNYMFMSISTSCRYSFEDILYKYFTAENYSNWWLKETLT